MPSGGLRVNAGRKKIGVVVNTRIDEYLIEQIELYIKGMSRADKIRKCLEIGVEHNKNLSKISVETNTISRFYKSYSKLLALLDKSENANIQILNSYLLGFFTSTIPDYENLGISIELHEKIIFELQKFSWSIDELENKPNLITPNLIGSVIEKLVNQKETGSYYTPKDTTSYIAQYSIVFSLLCKCNSPELAYNFYEQFNEPSNMGVLNDSANPIKAFANAINTLSENVRAKIFQVILNFTIVDPTCGTGAFIIAAADIMVELYRLTNMYLYISLNEYVINLFKNCLFGVEILDSAISLIILRCKLYLYNLGISRVIVDNIDFQFFCGDSLSSCDDENLLDEQNFYWETTFSSIFNNGGFDCVIGNPPYVENVKAGAINKYNSYNTKKCGNLYALILEKSLKILKDNSYMGMIIPISFTSTQRMEPLRKLLLDTCENIYIANFSDRPSCLFTGVHQKLSIVFIKKTKPTNGCKVYTSPYIHWSKSERNGLFDRVHYCRTTKLFINGYGIAKIGDEIKCNILKKVAENQISFDNLLANGNNDNAIYLNQRMTFWAKCFTSPEPSSEYKKYAINTRVNNKAVAALLNSSLFYLLWETYSDCWHITQSDLSNLKFSESFFNKDNQIKLAKLETALENKLYETREYIYSKQTDYIYVHRLCHKEITAINDFIAEIYGFSPVEQDYIQKYNLKYRLSTATTTEEE